MYILKYIGMKIENVKLYTIFSTLHRESSSNELDKDFGQVFDELNFDVQYFVDVTNTTWILIYLVNNYKENISFILLCGSQP